MYRVAAMVADGTEPVEVLAPVDAMRRAGFDVDVVSTMESPRVTLAQAIDFIADMQVDDTDLNGYDAILVPGGSVGVENLKKCAALNQVLGEYMARKHVFSICAGPTVLNELGLLEGRKVTCYPGAEIGFPEGSYVADEDIVVDGNLVTASGPGQALKFGIKCIKALAGKEVAQPVARDMLICKGEGCCNNE